VKECVKKGKRSKCETVRGGAGCEGELAEKKGKKKVVGGAVAGGGRVSGGWGWGGWEKK